MAQALRDAYTQLKNDAREKLPKVSPELVIDALRVSASYPSYPNSPPEYEQVEILYEKGVNIEEKHMQIFENESVRTCSKVKESPLSEEISKDRLLVNIPFRVDVLEELSKDKDVKFIMYPSPY